MLVVLVLTSIILTLIYGVFSNNSIQPLKRQKLNEFVFISYQLAIIGLGKSMDVEIEVEILGLWVKWMANY